MKLKFKQQQYQEDATMAVVNCFLGEQKGNTKDIIARYTADVGTLLEREVEEVAFGNHKFTLPERERRNNIREVQKLNDIRYTDDAGLTDFTIEMETGTGKTYTYIKTMYELNKAYGWSKFIVMTPSIAIREGVLKSFDITQDHFQELYQKKIRYFVYDSSNSSNIANINSFASDDSIQVMIMNYQAFSAKGAANRRIYEELDELQSRRPIDVIKSVNPILIIDEPQKLGDKTESLLDEFKPLFTIRYSATHKKNKEYNKVYRLDAVDAYNQKLVKKIYVKGIEILHNKSEGTYLYLDHVDISDKHEPYAYMELETKSSSGVTKKMMKIKHGDDLYTKSGELTEYKGFVVSEVDARGEREKVSFTNGVEIETGQAQGDVDENQIVRIQMRETIESHLEKEKQLHKMGIKVLSLFFIDEVAKYKDWSTGEPLKGIYAQMFEEEYQKAVEKFRTIDDEDYRKYLDSFETGKIHAGYFSVDKKGHEIDPKINDRKERMSFDQDAYDLIMKDKERLLSMEEPVRFIFSHSALREGWDNPNIFQICTLKHSNSEISKRQEIGRGLRICVNNNGDRMDETVLERDFHSVNGLTVIPSESYDSFARALQKEMAESLSDKSQYFKPEMIVGKEVVDKDGNVKKLTEVDYSKLLLHNISVDYVTEGIQKVQNKFTNDTMNNAVDLPEEYEKYRESITNLYKKFYTDFVDPKPTRELKPNDNFNKKEFQELWKKINYKTIYEVDFDSGELIDKSVKAIDDHLVINKLQARITLGEQKEEISSNLVKEHNSMIEKSGGKTETLEDVAPVETKYDLIGEITKETGLTRKTIIAILQGIKKENFDKFKYNPEEFIRKVSRLINDETATTVIDGITYQKTDGEFSNEIFTINNVDLRGKPEVSKNIYDYLLTDSEGEKKFASKMENSEVTVYAKLPNGFKIPTPVGSYNPDWAIVFDNKEFKWVYFIAETKGRMRSMELRGVEKAKIKCAKKHFSLISNENVKYGVVDSYEHLIDMVTGAN